jgi:Cys-rich repeat protein
VQFPCDREVLEVKNTMARPRPFRLGWLLAGLVASACGPEGQRFDPPLLLDRAGLTGRVALASEPLPFGQARADRLPGEAELAGHLLGLAGGTRLSLTLQSDSELALALYGPRRADGLFGQARAFTPETRKGTFGLAALGTEASGDYLVVVADPGRAGSAYRLAATCLAGCEAPRCPALICGLYCPTGFEQDAAGCARCACAAGCQANADCPLEFTCQAGVCRRLDPPGCDCPEPYAPVCGRDGRTYANACELDCAGGEAAHAGACQTPACSASADCPAGMLCQAGECRAACDCAGSPVALVCGQDGLTYPSDCERRCAGVGLSHLGPCDTCVPEVCGDGVDNDCDGFIDEGCGGACLVDADCPPDQFCLAGLCSGTLACVADPDCPAGQECQTGLCRPRDGCGVEICNGLDDDCDGLTDEGCPACRTNSDCPAYHDCVAGLCVEAVVDADGDGFSPPEDCDDQDASVNPAAPELCDGKDNNCDGQVDEGCPVACSSDADCAAGQVCVAGACTPACSSDQDCAAGEVCHEGHCVIPCRTDAECPAGQFCVGGICSP